MKNPLESSHLEPEDLKNKQIMDVVSFVKEHGVTSREISFAYQIALGFSADEIGSDKPVREEVYELARMIDKSTTSEVPVNKIIGLIETKGEYEIVNQTYFRIVDDMDISDKEKAVLKSIVEKKRNGILSIVDRDTKREVAEIEIHMPASQDKYSQNDVAALLLTPLLTFQGHPIEISFLSET